MSTSVGPVALFLAVGADQPACVPEVHRYSVDVVFPSEFEGCFGRGEFYVHLQASELDRRAVLVFHHRLLKLET